jgi:hypothetical protein
LELSKELNPGDKKDLVIEKMGKPDAFKKTNDGYVYIYRQRQISMNAWIVADYYYTFNNNNKLISIEQGAIVD